VKEFVRLREERACVSKRGKSFQTFRREISQPTLKLRKLGTPRKHIYPHSDSLVCKNRCNLS
jgi:hypothetical protein